MAFGGGRGRSGLRLWRVMEATKRETWKYEIFCKIQRSKLKQRGGLNWRNEK